MPTPLLRQSEIVLESPWPLTPTARGATSEDESEVKGVSTWNSYALYEALTYPRLWRRVRECLDELQSLRSLEANWDTYNANAPSNDAIRRAEKALAALIQNGYLPDRVVASAEGGVALCFTKVDSYADIEFANSGETLAVAYKLTEEPDVWSLTDDRQSILETAARIYNRTDA